MKVGFIHCAIVSAIIAVIGFVIFSSLDMETNVSLVIAAFLLISGIASPYIASLFGSSPSVPNQEQAATGETATLYVGNLPYKANEDAVKEYFSSFVHVQSVRLMKDRRTGKRKGYGFIEVVTTDVDKAIAELNDKIFLERTLKVRPAKEKGDEE
ncbi:RNA recognition motif domain-containing protein [Alteromonas lipotrueiana]|uniref:RNA recognition motif domain-containing protein n=1 Tax=Alteromonas lipotrueiana TaxID=2803815 RepID=UPI001C442268|nr:RNA-binding protein [Alteromonas lipotrueiana]